MKKEKRINQITSVAIHVADMKGFMNVTIAEVSRQAGVTHPLVSKYFGNLEGIREAICVKAVSIGHTKIMADIVKAGKPYIDYIPREQRAVLIEELTRDLRG